MVVYKEGCIDEGDTRKTRIGSAGWPVWRMTNDSCRTPSNNTPQPITPRHSTPLIVRVASGDSGVAVAIDFVQAGCLPRSPPRYPQRCDCNSSVGSRLEGWQNLHYRYWRRYYRDTTYPMSLDCFVVGLVEGTAASLACDEADPLASD